MVLASLLTCIRASLYLEVHMRGSERRQHILANVSASRQGETTCIRSTSTWHGRDARRHTNASATRRDSLHTHTPSAQRGSLHRESTYRHRGLRGLRAHTASLGARERSVATTATRWACEAGAGHDLVADLARGRHVLTALERRWRK